MYGMSVSSNGLHCTALQSEYASPLHLIAHC